MRQKKNKKQFLLVCILAAALLALGARAATLRAVFNQKEAVHIDPEEVEDATLIIGTHLIYLGQMNEKLYEIASDSAAESAQTEVYYKSELGGGKWYSVSDASSLADITVEGKTVPDEKIRSLWVTHHTRPDGKTYDLKTEKPVSIYEIISPYDLHKLPELQALERQREAGKDLGDFFELQVKDEAAEVFDEELRELEAFKERLQKTGLSDSQEEMLDQCMGRVDAGRRHRVYAKVREALDELTDASGAGDAAVNEAAGECIRQVEEALLETQSKMLDEGETVMTAAETRLQREFMEAAGNGQDQEAVKLLRSLAVLSDLMSGESKDPEEEKRLLDEVLIPEAKKRGAQNELDFYMEAKSRLEKTEEASLQELGVLYDEKEALQTERLGALDNNDLKEAARIEALVEEKDLEIQEKERVLEEKAASGQIAQEDLPSASGAANVRDMKEEALLAIEEGKEGHPRLQESVEGIGALLPSHPKAAGEALKAVYEKMAAESYLKEDASWKDVMKLTEELLAEHTDVLDSDFDAEEILEVLEEFSEDPEAVTLMGLSMYCRQTGREEAAELLKGMTQAAAGGQDACLFPVLPWNSGGAYAPAEAVAAWTSCRHIWNSNKKEATLASRGNYYRFQAFENIVERKGGKEETMESPCMFCAAVYIPESYIEQEFAVQVFELCGTGYGVLADEPLREKAAEVCDALTEKGGE